MWAWMLLALKPAWAATYTVCPSGCDYATIAAANNAGATADGDVLLVEAGSYTQKVDFRHDLTIRGSC